MIPTLVLLLIGGTVADRFSRRTLLITLNIFSTLSAAAMGLLLLTGHYRLSIFVLLAILNGAISAFSFPALRGIVPELVDDPRDLQRANAWQATSLNAVRILAPSIGGLLVATIGGGWALIIDAATYLAAALLFIRIPARSRLPAGRRAPLWRDLGQGWRMYWSMKWVVIMTVAFAALNALNVGPWNVLGPTIVSGHDGALGWSTVLSVRAIGLLVTSIVSIKINWRHPLRTGLLAGSLSSLPLLCLGLSGRWWIVAIAAFIGGIGFAVNGVTWETTLQLRVPRQALSRVTSYDDLLAYIAIPLSQLAVGPLAAAHGAARIAGFCGFGYLVAALLPLLNSTIRHLTSEADATYRPVT